jgi:outer membrane protein OmpA-like peptidoglycan-associated protein
VIAFGQSMSDPITLRNASFEGFPQASRQPDQWTNCGFPDESPPDTQPFSTNYESGWGQRIKAQEGFSYVGMVIRDNDTWERVSQKLSQPLEAGKCYEISLFLCSSPTYISQSRVTQQFVNYNKPCVLRIRGSRYDCDPGEIMAETKTIDHNFWKLYQFKLRPKNDVPFIMFEAFYKTPTLFSYNGNILIDNVSQITEIPCSDEILAFVEETTDELEEIAAEPDPIKQRSPINPDRAGDVEKRNEIPAEKILKDLERQNLHVGQTIKIQTLTFDTDSYIIRNESYPVLNEISQFLRDNEEVKVEIGGHTSRQPGIDRQYCLDLSTSRAESVKEYLVTNGVEADQLSFKGYGYSKPMANNVTKDGRLKNQRVEIKIIKLEI